MRGKEGAMEGGIERGSSLAKDEARKPGCSSVVLFLVTEQTILLTGTATHTDSRPPLPPFPLPVAAAA